MRKEDLIERISKHDPLLAKAVDKMVAYIQDLTPSTLPSKEQILAVNEYLQSIHADGNVKMSETNCELRRIASQRITIAAIPLLDSAQLNRLQEILDHMAYDKEYCV